MSGEQKKNRTANASMEQKKLLLEFIKKNPQLVSKKFSNTFSLKDAQNLWKTISNILNSCGNGASKDWKSWRKTWQDIRCRTKSKNSRQRQYEGGTGGGPFESNSTDQYEKEVLETINPILLEGDITIAESDSNLIYDDNINNKTENEQIVINTNNETPSTSDAINKNVVNEQRTLNLNVPGGNSRKIEKEFPRVPRKKLMHASEAAESYHKSLEKKNTIKENYYEKKIKILERSAAATERIASAKERAAAAKEEIAQQLSRIANAMESIQDSIS